MYHWTVRNWLAEDGLHGREFAIIVDADFIKMAKVCALECDQESAQEGARIRARKAGYKVDDSMNLLRFGCLGIQQIDHPYGGDCHLSLDTKSLGPDCAEFCTKNVDRADQQSLLFGIWVWWADYVSAQF